MNKAKFKEIQQNISSMEFIASKCKSREPAEKFTGSPTVIESKIRSEISTVNNESQSIERDCYYLKNPNKFSTFEIFSFEEPMPENAIDSLEQQVAIEKQVEFETTDLKNKLEYRKKFFAQKQDEFHKKFLKAGEKFSNG
ncbi:MAG: hypothetical protein IJT73_04930 [Selenomonadaceae bacterium]|nr:hypothetical protein [Selenomonadaceae bacterium]